MTLKFSPGNHSYWLDKKRVPGVTTLIGKGLPKDALMYWSARTVAEYVAQNPDEVETLRGLGEGPMIAALKGIPWQKRDEAAVRGTDVHAIAERIVHGEPIDVPEHLLAHVQGYVDWLDAFKVEPVLTERSVGHRALWYAGRFDLIADMAGSRWMLDVKTSKGVYGSTALQVDAYRNAEFYVDDDDPDTEHPLPEGIERLGVLHVTENGTELRPLDSTGEPFRIFKHVSYLAKKCEAIDEFIGDAVAELADL